MDEVSKKSSSTHQNLAESCPGDLLSSERVNIKTDFKFSTSPSFEDIRILTNEFVNERNWNQYHTPRNLLLAMIGEVGELSELFQWKGEVEEGLPDWTAKEKEHLGEELSDVLIYLLRLSEKCQIDLPAAVIKKTSKNKEKYPASKVWGSSKKYYEYKQEKSDVENRACEEESHSASVINDNDGKSPNSNLQSVSVKAEKDMTKRHASRSSKDENYSFKSLEESEDLNKTILI